MIVLYRAEAIWTVRYSAIRQLARIHNAARKMRHVRVPGMIDASDELRALCVRLKPVARWNSLYAMQGSNDNVLTMYFRIGFLLDIISLLRVAAFIHRNREDAVRLYALVGEIDACVSIASLRASLDTFAEPVFTEAVAVEAIGLAHPLIGSPIRNDILWRDNIMITGSNASGKSTFIKALAVNAIFAQTILTCWAERFSTPRAAVISSMALRDDVQSGESYFIVEIKSLRRILSSMREDMPALCFIDEILRGTNTIERIAASASLLDHVCGLNALCAAATHDIELARMLPAYRQYHFREEIIGGGMSFTYKLMDGVSDTRNAVKLLSLMDFPARLVSDAEEMVEIFVETGVWRRIERRPSSRSDTQRS
ncbi:MAG: DNA mismatch repair protein MutS [Oscillospiraceae bacterium]|jgi:DNA mismatch repair ATPase MutS|nr:DNA mismatch repair protein MutS [Oscillospiraceae bacterium]